MPFLDLLNPKQSSRGDGLNWIFMVSRAAGAGGGDKANGNPMLVEKRLFKRQHGAKHERMLF